MHISLGVRTIHSVEHSVKWGWNAKRGINPIEFNGKCV